MKRMLIIGGTGETGSWFARYFSGRGFDVSIWGPSGKTWVAEKLGVRYANDLKTETGKSDVVLLSVPIEKTVEVVAEVAPLMRPGSLLMDVTSLKSEPVKAMAAHAPPGVEVLGTHPMFGPTMPGIRGQTVILTPVEGRSNRWMPLIKTVMEEDGALVEVLDPEEHDEIMAVVQALTHFAYIGIGSALRALDFDVERSRIFMSPVYEIMLDFVGRILDQNPELYASIQGNPAAIKVRRVFIKECSRLSRLVEAGDQDGFQEAMREAARHYGKTHEALERSDALIESRIREEKERRTS